MADNSKVILKTLRAHFEKLVSQNTQLQLKCNSLQEQLTQMQEEITMRNTKIEKLAQELAQSEVRYKNLQLSQKAELNTQQLQENKEKFAKLVREIDKCISLLNE